jgi:transcriptional regulator with XRE-family HTH domain
MVIMADIKRLKQIKQRRHISLETMSREIGISSRTLFRWFHSEFNPSLLAQKLISNYIEKEE